MTELGIINKLIAEYTGKANNFKTGIVFEDDPDFGDKICITAIATGFKMGMLDQITDANLGNIIWIDDSFKYEKKISSEDGIELPEIKSEKIGYNNAAVRKKNLFSDGVKPVLVVSEGQNRSELENTAAIRRKASGRMALDE